MKDPEVRIVSAAEARRAITNGDIRSEVAFQNDINTLLARLEETKVAAARAVAAAAQHVGVSARLPLSRRDALQARRVGGLHRVVEGHVGPRGVGAAGAGQEIVVGLVPEARPAWAPS